MNFFLLINNSGIWPAAAELQVCWDHSLVGSRSIDLKFSPRFSFETQNLNLINEAEAPDQHGYLASGKERNDR